MTHSSRAPSWQTTIWLNRSSPLTLSDCRGRVVALHTFQMLCPACVLHSLPQAQRIHGTFSERDLITIGLHTVFEHHEAMGFSSLDAFVHEFGYSFPIGVDAPGLDGVPLTMSAYGLRGTPSLVLIDAAGQLRLRQFGRMDDLMVGAEIAQLIAEKNNQPFLSSEEGQDGACTPAGCPIPQGE